MKIQTQFSEIPSDAHLVLLCLDYLVDLRRNQDEDVLNGKKQLDADYIGLAAYALMQSIRRPDYLATKSSYNILDSIDMNKINKEVLSPSSTFQRPHDTGSIDLHPSNLYRFYPLNGLAGEPEEQPLLLTDLVVAGLKQTSARCRLEAEKDIVKSNQFELYIQSVTNRGFFNDPTNSGKRRDPKEEEERRKRKSGVYKEKYRKAIAKYREKLAVSASDGTAIMPTSMLSPPNSPPVKMNTSERSFSSPPRTCQMGTRESPLSPLTPNTAERGFSSPATSPRTPKTPRTPTSRGPRTPTSRGHRTPKKSLSQKTRSSSANMSKSSPSSTPVRSNASTPAKQRVRSASTTRVRSSTSTPVRSVSAAPTRSASSKPVRSVPSTPVRPTDSASTRNKIEDSPQSTLGKMARRRASKAPKESPLDATNSNRSSSTSRASRRRFESSNNSAERPVATKPRSLPKPHSPETTEASTKSFDPSGFSPIDSSESGKSQDTSPTASMSPEVDVKVQGFSLYELNLVAIASSGLEANAGSFHSVASPITRRRKSEYEKKIEEQKRWACPASLALPNITNSPGAEEAKPARKGRPQNINTSRGQETKQSPRTPKASASAKHIKVDAGRVSDSVGPSHGSHPRSPVARVRREKNEEELHRLRRSGESSSSLKREGALSPSRFSGLKKVSSNDDTSWIAAAKRRSSKAAPSENKEERTRPKESSPSFRKKASAFHASSGSKPTVGQRDRMPANSPKAELKIDPFKFTPPKFLGTSRLFAATVGTDSRPEGTKQPGSSRLSSPRGMVSPRGGLRSSPRNFNSAPIQRTC